MASTLRATRSKRLQGTQDPSRIPRFVTEAFRLRVRGSSKTQGVPQRAGRGERWEAGRRDGESRRFNRQVLKRKFAACFLQVRQMLLLL